MTTVSKMQQQLGALPQVRVDTGTAPVSSRIADEPTFAAAVQNARTPAWDPHDVWLNRVKKPREQR